MKDEKAKIDPMKAKESGEAKSFAEVVAGGPRHSGGFASSLVEKPITSFRDLKK